MRKVTASREEFERAIWLAVVLTPVANINLRGEQAKLKDTLAGCGELAPMTWEHIKRGTVPICAMKDTEFTWTLEEQQFQILIGMLMEWASTRPFGEAQMIDALRLRIEATPRLP